MRSRRSQGSSATARRSTSRTELSSHGTLREDLHDRLEFVPWRKPGAEVIPDGGAVAEVAGDLLQRAIHVVDDVDDGLSFGGLDALLLARARCRGGRVVDGIELVPRLRRLSSEQPLIREPK